MTAPKHVVILGAARSGTKVLRDALATSTGAGTVPYDIGYVWRRGNEAKPDDVLQPADMSSRSRRFVRRFVNRYQAGDPGAVLEKTVGNTMRVAAVASVFPDARYIHLIRDGVDVIESTRRQWTAPPDVSYLLRKVRHFPLRLVPTYGVKYLRSLARRRASERRIGSWGPRYPGIDTDLGRDDLLVVCARQWSEAVRRAGADLQQLELPVITVRYEDLVGGPEAELRRIADFVGLAVAEPGVRRAAAKITDARQGTGRNALTAAELELLDAEVGDLLAALYYDRPLPQRPHVDEKPKD